jgi:hypothetical protein
MFSLAAFISRKGTVRMAFLLKDALDQRQPNGNRGRPNGNREKGTVSDTPFVNILEMFGRDRTARLQSPRLEHQRNIVSRSTRAACIQSLGDNREPAFSRHTAERALVGGSRYPVGQDPNFYHLSSQRQPRSRSLRVQGSMASNSRPQPPATFIKIPCYETRL